ncbi:flagellar hook-basal body protein [bacterium]|nr:flagellar hook-basal body protein [bacterium]
MITRGLESATNGMKALIDYQDVVANNIANVNTTSFKRTNIAFKNVMDMVIADKSDMKAPTAPAREMGILSAGPMTDRTYLDFSQGTLIQTGKSLDIAIEGGGFFKIKEQNKINEPTNETNTYYSRNGSFHLTDEYYLVNNLGDYVLDDQNRRIRIVRDPEDPENNIDNRVDVNKDITISENGTINVTNPDYQRVLQTIQIVDFDNLENVGPIGDSRYRVLEGRDAGMYRKTRGFTLNQGSLEGANVNTVHEMIHTISISRAYETLATMVRTQGESLSTAIELGKIKG